MRSTLYRVFAVSMLLSVFVLSSINTFAQSWNVELVRFVELGKTFEVKPKGRYVYCSVEYSGLVIIDVSDPTAPRQVGKLDLPGSPIAGITVSGNYAYLADRQDGLRVVDVSDPSNPREIGRVPCYAFEVYASGNYVYVTGRDEGLRVIDVSDPTSPREVGRCCVGTDVVSVYKSGQYVYATAVAAGLRVIDVSDPTNPREVGYFQWSQWAMQVHVLGNLAYTAVGWAGLRVVDVSDPTNPREIAHFNLPDWAYDVQVAGRYAYVADNWAGLRVIDVSDLSNLREVGYYVTGGWSGQLSISGGYIFLTDQDRGFFILRFTGAEPEPDTTASLQTSPESVPANSEATSTLTLTYRYTDGTPIVGRTIRFQSSRGTQDTFSSETAVTDSEGKASVTVRSGTPGVSTYTCRDETVGVDLPASAQVTFTPVEGEARKPVIGSVTKWLLVTVDPKLPPVPVRTNARGPFFQFLSPPCEINVRVADWAGSPGRVVFELNGRQSAVEATSSDVLQRIDLATQLEYGVLGKWNELRVTAYNREGVPSETQVLHFFAIGLPASLRLWLPGFQPVTLVREDSIEINIPVEWPDRDIHAAARVPAPLPLMGDTVWGHETAKIVGEVSITLVPLEFPETGYSGEVAASFGWQVGRKYNRTGRPPKHTVKVANFGWETGLNAQATFAIRPIKLENFAIGFEAGATMETTDLLPLLTGPIPALAPLVPVIDLFGRFSVAADGTANFWDTENGFGFRSGELELSFPLSLVASLDRSLSGDATLEAEGGGSPFAHLQYPGSSQNAAYFGGVPFIHQVGLDLFLKVTIQFKVLFLDSNIEFDLARARYVYPDYGSGGTAKLVPLFSHTLHVQWTAPARAYLTSRSPYHQVVSQAGRLLPLNDSWDVQETPLILNTMPSADPVLTWKDGRAVILYVWDDPNLPAHQSTEIRALMQQPDGSWRDVPVTQDTALDSQPSVAVDDLGNLVAVWTRLEDVPPLPDPELRLPKGEIAYSVYNESTGQWGAPRKVTNDNVLDFRPQLVRGADGGLYLHWLKSPDNTMPFNLENPSLPHTDIWTAIWNGTRFVFASRAVQHADTLEASLAVNSLGYPMLVWSADADGNPETEDSRLLYTYWDGSGWLSPMPVRADTSPQSSPTLAIAQGDLPVLFFVRSGLPHPQHEGYTQEQLVVTTFNGAGWAQPTPVTQANTLSDLQVNVTPEGKVSAMWVSSSEGVVDIWTTVFDGALGSYSQPVRLTQDDMTHEQQLSAAWDPAGNPSAVYIKRRLETEGRQVQDAQGNWYPIEVTVPKEADLYLLSHRPMPDLTLSELWVDPSNAGGGMPVTIKAKVRNLRALGASNVRVRFYDGDPNAGGIPIGTVTVSPSNLVGGGEGEATLQWTLPDDGKARTLYARVDPDNAIAEKDETNNAASWVVAQLDLAAVAPYVAEYLPDGRLKVKFGLQNPSAVNAEVDVPYRLRLGDAQGEVLVSGSLRTPARGGVAMTEWIWSPQVSAGRYTLYLEIDPDNGIEESDEGNNVAQSEVALAADLLVNPALTWLERGTGGQATVHTTIQNNGWAEAQNVVVQVRTALEGGTVLASATVERLGRYDVSSLSLSVSLAQAGSEVWVVVNPDGAIDEVRRDNNMVGLRTGLREYSVSGQVALQDFVGDLTAVPVTVEVRQGGNVVRTEVLLLDAQGGYTLANLTPGTYELAFKASHWLRRVRTVEVVASDVLGVSVSLVNGDVDGDNEVGVLDFGTLVSAFGSVPGDAAWNANADLNGDGEVNLLDLGILLRNFGEVGDD